MAETATVGRFCTADPDVAVRETSRLIGPHQLVLTGDRARFSANVSRARLGDIALHEMSYSVGGTFHCPAQASFVAVVLACVGDLVLTYHGASPIVVPCGSYAVIPADDPVDIGFDDGMSLAVLTATVGTLAAGLRRIAPQRSVDRIAFARGQSDAHTASTFFGIAGLIRRTVERYETPSAMPSTVVNALRDQAVSTFLLDLTHAESDALLSLSTPVPNRTLQRALELIGSDDGLGWSVTAIASNLDVSVRSLEKSFRKQLGCTPREYMQNVRLQRAHDELRRAEHGDGTTVTDVALRCGFSHVGRFATLYRNAYGVVPSAELRGRVGSVA